MADMNNAQQMYGVTANLINSIPQLAQYLNTAVQQGWTQDHLNAVVAQDPWYRSNGQNLRNLLMQQATDPATFNQNLANAQQKVRELAGQLGHSVDVNGLAWQSLVSGWDDNTLSVAISQQRFNYGDAGNLTGDAARIKTHLQQTAQNYGVPYTPQFMQDWVSRIQVGGDTTDGFDALMKARAKAAYPQFAAQLDGGLTLHDIADPYMATMAKTLELSQNSITLDNPYIKRALSAQKAPDGTPTSMPLYQFESQVKQDPRYEHTDAARGDAMQLIKQIGNDFGFMKS